MVCLPDDYKFSQIYIGSHLSQEYYVNDFLLFNALTFAMLMTSELLNQVLQPCKNL